MTLVEILEEYRDQFALERDRPKLHPQDHSYISGKVAVLTALIEDSRIQHITETQRTLDRLFGCNK